MKHSLTLLLMMVVTLVVRTRIFKNLRRKRRVKEGQLGFYRKKHFDIRTNFSLEVKADIYSNQYQLKGLSEALFKVRRWIMDTYNKTIDPH